MRVALLVSCLVDGLRPSVGAAALALLREAGCTVRVPRQQTCCGQPAWNSGDRPTAQALALKVLEDFADVEAVVVPLGKAARAWYASCLRSLAPNILVLLRRKPWRRGALKSRIS